MGVGMANCGHDENGNYHGGQAGDQSGTEWYLCSWYSYPWDYIIRWRDGSLADLFAELAVEAANNNMIGYDQWQRDTFLINLEDSGWRPKDITVPCETDCSKGTIDLIKAVGHLKGIRELQEINATYTGNMLPWFKSAAGQKHFTVLTGKYLTSPSLARKGDINLNVQNHTNITVDNGASSGAQSPTPPVRDPNAGKIGNCTVTLHTFLKGAHDNQIKAIQTILKRLGYKGKGGKELEIDGHLGDNTAYALEQFQRANGMKNINFGTVVATTWTLLLGAK